MQRLLGLVALILFAARAEAQPLRPQLPAAQALQYEADLKSNPKNLADRSALLDYYYRNSSLDPAEAIPARRRHILWLIQNTPADGLAGGPAATIDPTGHRLADPEGFELASDAWRKQVARRDTGATALTNAAYFFKLSDKEFAVRLLERAVTLEPANKEIGARLGDEYALAILGVTMINQNGFPMVADADLAQSPLAMQARERLNTSRNPYALAKAGYMLSFQGGILRGMGKLDFDAAPLAESALKRAVSLAPGEQDVAQYLERHRDLQREIHPVTTAQSVPEPAAAPIPIPAPPPLPPPPQVTVDDLKRATLGMNREQLLKLGAPAGRITMDESGHLIEIFRYSANGASLGVIRLTDGAVSSVEIP